MPTAAQAALLESKTVNLQYFLPDMATPFADPGNGNYAVGAGVEVPDFANSRTSVDFSDTNILLDFDLGGAFFAVDFNGFRIFDVNGDIADIVGVSINALTNMVGLDDSRITFDANTIWVNWQGLIHNADTIVSLDLIGREPYPNPIPEPAALGLLGMGILGLAGARRLAGRHRNQPNRALSDSGSTKTKPAHLLHRVREATVGIPAFTRMTDGRGAGGNVHRAHSGRPCFWPVVSTRPRRPAARRRGGSRRGPVPRADGRRRARPSGRRP